MKSRVRKTRSAPAEADPAAQAAEQAPAVPRHGQGHGGPPLDGFDGPDGQQPAPATDPAAPRQASRRALKNWHVRSRLVLLITIPTLTAIILGGIRIDSSARSAIAYQQVARLASLSSNVADLGQALELERSETVKYIVRGQSGGRGSSSSSTSARLERQVLASNQHSTDVAAGLVRRQAQAIGGSYPPLVRQEAQAAVTAIDGLPALRFAAVHTRLPVLAVIQQYENTIDAVLALNDEIALGSNDSALADTVRVLGFISRMKEEASEQGAILTSALAPDLVGKGSFRPDKVAALTTSETEQASNLQEFGISATAAQRQLYQSALSGTQEDRALALEQQAAFLASDNAISGTDPTIADASSAMTFPVSSLRVVEQQIDRSINSRAATLRKNAIAAALIIGAAVLLVLLLALIFTIIIGRSMVRPLRRLRAGALDVAGIRLPDTVRRMSEADHDVAPADVEPIDVDSLDEIGEVARAFDQVHREALRLAANEAALRGNVNAMFVNLSRRSQSLVERQIRLIDELEQGEQDSERLGSLFQMDHLATRMRRNSENLLVLAGHDSSRRWNQPVPLVDVLRAAISEIEQYERVTLNVQPGISVRGQAVNDVVHLLAELAENATSFSSADTPVNVSGHLLTSGGVLLDISDLGVGMGTEEMAHANWRLDNPPVVDVAVSRRMGLFVVARLAARHGIRVRLRPATGVGLTALVWLPDEVVVRETAARSGGPGQFPEPLARFAIGSPPAGLNGPAGPAQVGTGAPVGFGGPVGSGDWRSRRSADRRARSRGRARAQVRPAAAGRGGCEHPARPAADSGRGPASGSVRPDLDRTEPRDRWRLGSRLRGAAALAEPAAFAEYVPSQAIENEWSAPAAAGTGERPAQPAAAWGTGELAQPAADWTTDRQRRPGARRSRLSPPPRGRVISPLSLRRPPKPPPLQRGRPIRLPRLLSLPPRGQVTSQNTRSSARQPLPCADREAASFAGLALRVDKRRSDHPAGDFSGRENRLPIFEAVESDWFRRGRSFARRLEVTRLNAFRPGPGRSPADEGWKVAEAAARPVSAAPPGGLAKRVPKANLYRAQPGKRCASARSGPHRRGTRDRFASFQRGMREGRAASAHRRIP